MNNWVRLLLAFVVLILNNNVFVKASSSCSQRVANICPHSDSPSCCEGKRIRLANTTIVDCSDAIDIFYSNDLHEAIDDQDCDFLRFFIENSLHKTGCPCGGNPTPAPIPPNTKPCAERGEQYLPCEQSQQPRCCPTTGGNKYPIYPPNGNQVSCGVARQALFDYRSTTWTENECLAVKMNVEGILPLNGCSCFDPVSPPLPSPTTTPPMISTQLAPDNPSSPPTQSPTTTSPTQSPTQSPITPSPTTSAPTSPPSLGPVTTPSPVSRSQQLCNERTTVPKLCVFTGICEFADVSCWTGSNFQEDVVRNLDGSYITCSEAWDLYMETTSMWSDNECYLLLFGFKNACKCSSSDNTTSPANSNEEAEEAGKGGSCFSGSSLVTVQGKGVISMKDVSIGDYVLTNNNSNDDEYHYYEPVYSFGHYEPQVSAKLLQITTTLSKASKTLSNILEISAEHLVRTPNRGFIPASSLVDGDFLLNSNHQEVQVVSIKAITKRNSGLYAPFTPSGQLIVNDIMVSSFVAIGDDDVSSPFSHQWLAHTFEFPHRLLCYYTTRFCPTETYDSQGLSQWVAQPFKFSRWLLSNEKGGLVKNMIQVMIIMLLMIFSCMENVLLPTVASITAVCCMLLLGVLMIASTTTLVRLKRIKTTTR